MKKIHLIAMIAVLFAASALVSFKIVSKSAPVSSEGPIQWMTLDQAQALSKKKPKKYFVDVYTDWCGWCKVMDKKTFSDAKVAEYANKKYYAIKLNAESANPVTYQGKTITERELAAAWGVTGYPTTMFLDEQTNLITAVPGYLDLPTFDKIVRYFGEVDYKKVSIQEFEKTYVYKGN